MMACVQAMLAEDTGTMNYEICDLEVVPGHGVAFCYGLRHVRGTTRDGKKNDMFWRATQGCQFVDVAWRIVHEHSSAPFDMKTGKVSFSLKP